MKTCILILLTCLPLIELYAQYKSNIRLNVMYCPHFSWFNRYPEGVVRPLILSGLTLEFERNILPEFGKGYGFSFSRQGTKCISGNIEKKIINDYFKLEPFFFRYNNNKWFSLYFGPLINVLIDSKVIGYNGSISENDSFNDISLGFFVRPGVELAMNDYIDLCLYMNSSTDVLNETSTRDTELINMSFGLYAGLKFSIE